MGQTDSLFTGAVFFAVGWTGNIDSLELEAAGIATDRGYIAVNEYLQTNVPHIYAVGDVNGQSMLVPSAAHEGLIAAENAVLGPHHKYSRRIVSSGSFTDPEYASVGLTESQARAASRGCQLGTELFSINNSSPHTPCAVSPGSNASSDVEEAYTAHGVCGLL